MCGPISRELYDIAVEELKISMSSYPLAGKFPLSMTIDRLGVHATRVQIETLQDDLKDCEAFLAQTQSAFDAYRAKAVEEFEDLQAQFDKDLSSQLDFFELKLQAGEASLAAANAEIDRLKLILASTTAEQKSSSSLSSPRLSFLQNSAISSAVLKLQARARGFLARSRVKRTRMFIAAKQSGVLIALRKTVQGTLIQTY